MKKSEFVDGTKRFAWNSSKESWVVHQKWNSRLFILKPNLGGCYYVIDYYSIIFNYHPIIQLSYLIIIHWIIFIFNQYSLNNIQVLFSYNSIIFKRELSGWVAHQKWKSRLFILNLGGCCYIINYYSILFNSHSIIQLSYSTIIQVSL